MRRASGMRSRCLTALVVLAALAVLPEAASAGVVAPVDGSFSITPARRYVVARPSVALAPTRVSNTTPETMKVRVIPVLLGQQSSGAFDFGTTPAELAAARRLLGAGPTRFTLRPGAVREVALRWRRLAPGARTAHLGVIYQAVPVGQKTRMRIVEQLLNVNLMRLPGRYRVLGSLTGLHVSQARPRVLALTLGVHDGGDVFAKPSHMTISIRSAGKTVLRRSLRPDIVLPGVTREFVLDVTHVLPPGHYTAIGRARLGTSRKLVTSTSFTLTGPNELPASEVHVGRLIAAGEVGGRANVSAAVSNSGTAAGGTRIKLDLYRLEKGVPATQPIASGHLDTTQLGPGGRMQVKGELGRLRKGTYRLLASYRSSAGAPQTLVVDFQAHQTPQLLARLRGAIREHLLLIPGLLLLLDVVLLVTLLLRERSLKRARLATRPQITYHARARSRRSTRWMDFLSGLSFPPRGAHPSWPRR